MAQTEHPTVIFASINDKAFTDYDLDAFKYKDEKLGIFFETQQILEDTMLLLRFNCPDPSCDVACRNWPALKAHVKSIHHRYLWYPSPPYLKSMKFLIGIQFIMYTTQKGLYT